MNFTQMHERLRQELLRRIERGTLSVSLLARQTGFGASHLSNFLREKRQLSLEAMDRILASQHLAADDLLTASHRSARPSLEDNAGIPVVSSRAVLFEPYVRPETAQMMLHLPPGLIESLRDRATDARRRSWQRFVALRTTSDDALPMEPLIFPDAYVIIDRHYNALAPYWLDRASVFAIQYRSQLRFRYVEFTDRRLILRPHNREYPVELIEVDPGFSPAEFIAGRIAHILNAT